MNVLNQKKYTNGPSPSLPEGERDYFGYEWADPILYSRLKELAEKNRVNSTKSEKALWLALKAKKLNGFKFRRQHVIGRFITDFVCLSRRLIIEVGGNIHQLPENKQNDQERTNWLSEMGFKVIRFENNQILFDLENVLKMINRELTNLPAIKDEILSSPSGRLGGAFMSRYRELISHIKKFGKVIVAFSGGIDSYLVLKAAIDSLGHDNVLAVTADSPSLKDSEKNETKKLAGLINANHKIIFTEELENPDYYNNPANRCFFCKDELYTKLDPLKNELGYEYILDGTNFDDMSDYRPGYKASKNHDILSPLVELKFTKEEIRNISKELGLEIWDKPSSPCLSSRIPYGQKVTLEKLSLIEQAEEIVKSYGFREFRVRHFEFDKPGTADKKLLLAKVDISHEEIEKYLSPSLLDELNTLLKSIGYDFVTLDMAGLQAGSLNMSIKLPVTEKSHN